MRRAAPASCRARAAAAEHGGRSDWVNQGSGSARVHLSLASDQAAFSMQLLALAADGCIGYMHHRGGIDLVDRHRIGSIGYAFEGELHVATGNTFDTSL